MCHSSVMFIIVLLLLLCPVSLFIYIIIFYLVS